MCLETYLGVWCNELGILVQAITRGWRTIWSIVNPLLLTPGFDREPCFTHRFAWVSSISSDELLPPASRDSSKLLWNVSFTGCLYMSFSAFGASQ